MIYRDEDTIEQVYFPHTGVISLVVGLTSGQFVEAGMLGRNCGVGAGAPLDGAITLAERSRRSKAPVWRPRRR